MWLPLLMLLQAVAPIAGVTLAPGDSIIVRPTETDEVIVVTDHAAAGQRAGPGEVRVDFRVTDGQSFLTLQNNDDRSLDYRAAIVRGGGRAVPSDVCRVMGGDRMGVEHWPYAIRSIALFGFHRTSETDIVCR